MGEMTRDQVLQRVRRNEKLERADLRGIDLSRAALTGAMLSRADLEGGNLEAAESPIDAVEDDRGLAFGTLRVAVPGDGGGQAGRRGHVVLHSRVGAGRRQ